MFIDFFLEPLYQNISRMPFSLHSVNLGQINKFKTYFSSVLTPFTSLMEGLKYELKHWQLFEDSYQTEFVSWSIYHCSFFHIQVEGGNPQQ